MFLKIDAYIYQRVEWFSHWVQSLTGLTNFWLAKWGVIIQSLLFIWAALNPGPAQGNLLMFIRVAAVFAIAEPVVFALGFGALEEYYAQGRTVAHWLTIKWREARITRAFLGIVTISNFCLPRQEVFFPLTFSFAFILLFIGFYLRMVIPLPSGKSRIQAWSESFKPSRQLVVAPSHGGAFFTQKRWLKRMMC